MDRRRFVTTTGLGVAGLAAGCAAPAPQSRAQADAGMPRDAGLPPADTGPLRCEETGADIEGPFYRPGVPIRSDLDLYGETADALILAGTVTDSACRPIENAVVEIWHANPAGDYDITTDEKRYYGQVATDASGAYSFITLMPGRYLNGPTYRPAHIHMKVFVGTTERLTTQIYFDGDPFSAGDAFFDAARSVPVTDGTAIFAVTV